MRLNLTRRRFIQISSATAAAGAVGINPIGLAAKPTGKASKTGETTPTYCEICFWKCAGWVHKDASGKPWKLTGNAQDQHCFGRLCTRGNGGMGAYLDPDRLKKPLLRVEGKEQSFKEVSWDEALGFIADKMKKIEREHGKESVALFSHGTGGGFFKTLIKAWGSPHITAPSYAQCRGPRAEGFKLTFGEGVGSPERTDIKNSKCLVLMGSHIGENLHNNQVQEFAEAIDKGCSIITVDPRFSTAASKSKFWLPIKPSTDTALVLAWINCLISEGIYDKGYVAKYTIGFDKLKESVKGNTPEWAYPITGIEPDVIRQTAREMAKNAPATLVHPSRHVTWYGDDTQRCRAIAILNGLLGCWGMKGGFYYQNKAKVPKFKIPKFKKPKVSPFDLCGDDFPFASKLPASVVVEQSIPKEGKTAPIKGWIVYGTNLIQCVPDQKKTIEAINNLDLIVAVDTMPAEITGWADVVLPECTYLERYDDIRTSAGRRSQIALRAPAFKPLYDSKPGWWIAKKLAEKLSLSKYFPWNDIEEYLETRLSKVGSSLSEMKRLGVKFIGDDEPNYLAKGEAPSFRTPSGKIEFYSSDLESAGFDPIPKYQAHEGPPKDYFRLLYGRSPSHTFGRTINNPLLNQLQPENEVWVNKDVAKSWNLKQGQYVVLRNQSDVESTKIKVRVTERIRPDCVYMVHGFGHTDKRLRRCHGRGADDSKLITKVKVDPIMGGTGMRGNFVTFVV